MHTTRLLLVPFTLLAAGVASAAPATPVEVPFNFHQQQIRLKVRINGQGPFTALLDTGANVTVLSEEVARQLGIKEGKRRKVGEYYGTSDTPPTYYNTDLKQVEIGELAVKDVTAIVATIPQRGGPEERLDAVLGYSEILHGRVLRIDYPRRTLTLAGRSPAETPLPVGSTSLPFTFRDGFWERLAEVHGAPKFEVRVNGQKAYAQLDTGYNGVFLFSAAATSKLELTLAEGEARQAEGAGGRLTYRPGTAERFEIGTLSLSRPRVSLMAPEPTARTQERKYDVNIGNGFLKEYVVTVDYRKKRLTLSPPQPGS
jgi:predicted aspartyl protease